MKHVLSASAFTQEEISEIFGLADKLKNNEIMYSYRAKGKILGSLFFEPSTRTRWSTEVAMIRLGGEVLSMEHAKESSSDRKGESLRDTIKTCSQYVDALVVRHPVERSIQEAALYSDVPVINGGDGSNEHPTQALLDLYTITRHFKNLDDKRILFTGDLDYSRTVHSLIKLLNVFNQHNVWIAGEGGMGLSCPNNPVTHLYHEDLYNALPKIDILYMTRHQVERKSPREKSQFVLTKELACTMKKDAIIMHPLPRTSELPPEVDDNHRSVYFEQAKNGMWIRMALLWKLLGIGQDDVRTFCDSTAVE